MEENRSFDHLLGHLRKTTNGKVDGLTGKEWNPVDPFNPSKGVVNISFTAADVGPDGGHSVPSTTTEVFGGPNMTHLNPAPMNGFVADAYIKGKGDIWWGKQVMAAFTSETLPILSTLAEEFAVFDHWYASIPGPTEVNRAYLHSATSDGCADGTDEVLALGFPQKTLFQQFDEVGQDWGVFFELLPSALFMRQLRDRLENFHSLLDFEAVCKSGNLPAYSFLEPRWYSVTDEFPANDQHPSHAVSEGEKLIKWVYETVRASPAWNETALIILYDEHGGYYDHVPTPLDDIPNPDGKVSTDPAFDFRRLGLRVPVIIASPWVDKGTVVGESVGPMPSSHYEHSSIAATFKKIFGFPNFLTKRDEWAGTFENLFTSRTEPRTDCPTTLPPVHKTKNTKEEHAQPMNDLQLNLLALAKELKKGEGKHVGTLDLETEMDGALFVQKVTRDLFSEQGEEFNSELLNLN